MPMPINNYGGEDAQWGGTKPKQTQPGPPAWMLVPGGTPGDPTGQARGIMLPDGSMVSGELGGPARPPATMPVLPPAQPTNPLPLEAQQIQTYNNALADYFHQMGNDTLAAAEADSVFGPNGSLAQAANQYFAYTADPTEQARLDDALARLLSGRQQAQGGIDAAFNQSIGEAQKYGIEAAANGAATGAQLAALFNQAASDTRGLVAANAGSYGNAAGFGPIASGGTEATDLAALLAAAAPREQAVAQQLGQMWQDSQKSYATGLAAERAAQQGALERQVSAMEAALRGQYMDREAARRSETERARNQALMDIASSGANYKLDARKEANDFFAREAEARLGEPADIAKQLYLDDVARQRDEDRQKVPPLPKTAEKAINQVIAGIGSDLVVKVPDGDNIIIPKRMIQSRIESAVNAAWQSGANNAQRRDAFDQAMMQMAAELQSSVGLSLAGFYSMLSAIEKGTGASLNARTLFPGD